MEQWLQTRCTVNLSVIILTGRLIYECCGQTAYTVFLLFGSLGRIFRYEAHNFSHKCTLLLLTQHFIIRCMFVRASLYKRRKVNQLHATEWFIALIICSTCFGHLYAHPQELETLLVLLLHMVCNALVAGGRRSGVGQQAMRPG